MKLAFIQAYNEADWIAAAIDQAMIMCDRLVIAEGAQWVKRPDIPERSDDGTLDIIADKRLEYRGCIRVINTVRKYQDYRKNQCANFNLALTHCQLGDYFIPFDCDEFFLDNWMKQIQELMKYGVDVIRARALNFAFGFDWLIDFGASRERFVVFRKVKGLRFKPSHRPFGCGTNEGKIPGIGFHHYAWLKRWERLLIRIENGRRPHMTEWLKKNWEKIVLEEGTIYEHGTDRFGLKRFHGDHPELLENHPWRYIEDIRSAP